MIEQVQALLGWFDPQEAISDLLGARLPKPGEDVSAQREIFESRRRATLNRPAYRQSLDAPHPIEGIGAAEQADLLHLLIGAPTLAEGRHSLSLIDLRRVVSVQKHVGLNNVDVRLGRVGADNAADLVAVFLPRSRPRPGVTGTFDLDGRGATITSLDRNLRVGLLSAQEQPGIAIGLSVTVPFHGASNFVHVVEFKGRWFLRDGYHRCVALLRRGQHFAPAVFQRARTFRDVIAPGPACLAHEHLFGTHPPMLADFLDSTVSETITRTIYRKVFRIRVDEFYLAMDEPAVDGMPPE